MNGTNTTINSLKGVSTLVRARFGPGMLLQHEDLEALNTYTRELSRLMFRSLFGCGVVCGLVVTTKPNCEKVLTIVSAGLALGCSGDPIYLPSDQTLALDEKCDPDLRGPLWVIVCSTTKCCSPRPSMCASDEDEPSSVCTRERDGFEIRIVSELPKCVCGCLDDYESDFQTDCKCVDPNNPCYVPHYDGKCKCDAGPECDCCCECVVLARLTKRESATGSEWTADHSVRRFVRPVLMRDPQVEIERANRKTIPSESQSQSQSQSTPDLKPGAKQVKSAKKTLKL